MMLFPAVCGVTALLIGRPALSVNTLEMMAVRAESFHINYYRNNYGKPLRLEKIRCREDINVYTLILTTKKYLLYKTIAKFL